MRRGAPRRARALLAAALAGAASPAAARAQDGAPTAAVADTLLVRGPLRLHHLPAHARLAERLATTSLEAPALPALDAAWLDRPIDVYLAPDETTFARLTGGHAPEWGAGIAIPATSSIVLPAYATPRATPQQLPGILRHELAHVALHRSLPDLRIPRWFDEGYARWAAGELDPAGAWRIRLAFALGRAPPLDSLTLDWPREEQRAGLAYLLAASAIEYLVAEGGERGLRLAIERWREGGDLDAAMRETYGVTQGQFEEDWRGYVKRHYGWAGILAQTAAFWSIGAVLLVWLWVRRRRTNRDRLARLRATEPPDAPAWWAQGHGIGPEEGEERGRVEPPSSSS